MNHLSKWQRLRRYINEKDIGDTITRQEILKKVYKNDAIFKTGSMTTIDTYRRMLELIDVLHVKKPGVYKIKYHIREDLKLSELANLAYGSGYRQWFNDAKVTE